MKTKKQTVKKMGAPSRPWYLLAHKWATERGGGSVILPCISYFYFVLSLSLVRVAYSRPCDGYPLQMVLCSCTGPLIAYVRWGMATHLYGDSPKATKQNETSPTPPHSGTKHSTSTTQHCTTQQRGRERQADASRTTRPWTRRGIQE